MKKYYFLISCLLVAVLSGCGMSANSKKSDKQTATYYEAYQVQSIDPAIVADDAGFNIVSNSFEGLFGFDRAGKIIPLGAASVPKVEDSKKINIDLRKDAKWSDGTQVTSADYLRNFERAITLNSPYKSLFKMFVNGAEVLEGKKSFEEIGIRATDEYSIEFNLVKSEDNFLSVLTLPVFFPTSKLNVEKSNAFYNSDLLTYNGPFVVKKFKVGQECTWTLSRNENYWDKKNVQLTKIVGETVQDNGIRLGNYNKKKSDLIPITQISGRNMAEDPEYATTDYFQTGFIMLNKESLSLKSKDVREMIYSASKRQESVELALFDYSLPTLSLLPLNKESSKFDTWKKADFDYDKDKAIKYYKKYESTEKENSKSLTIIAPSQVEYRRIAERLQFSLDVIAPKIQLSIELLNPVAFQSRLNDGNYDMAVCKSVPTIKDNKVFTTVFEDFFIDRQAKETTSASLNKGTINEAVADRWINPIYQTNHSYIISRKLQDVQLRSSGASLYFKNAYLVN